jgi:uncharacterized protein (DUF1810 family)
VTERFDLERFVRAQDSNGTYSEALAELRRGRKETHWMWFVFPQITGLGRSETSRQFAISGGDEARAYLEHPVLGPRLRECCTALLGLDSSDATAVLGGIDAQKLKSSMTLFAAIAPEESVFQRVLDHFFAGERDSSTIRLLHS